jgi:hypothetical protein
VRDGRDVLVSYYHHQLIWNEKNKKNKHDVQYHRDKLNFKDVHDIKNNMLSYMRYAYEHVPPKFVRFVFPGSWHDYNNIWLRKMAVSDNIYLVRYEDLLEDTYKTVKELLIRFYNISEIDEDRLHAIVDKFSFENQTKRKKGEESKKSFLRKGIRGDWKNYFNEESKEQFKRYSQNILIELGYEDNNNW